MMRPTHFRTIRPVSISLWILAVAAFIVTIHGAGAATFTVDTTTDNSGSASDPTTLRGAILAAEASTDTSDTINITSAGVITLTQGELDIFNGKNVSNKTLTINGSGGLAVSGGKSSRVFHIESNGNGNISVTFFNLGIIDGNAVENESSTLGGGGIAVSGESLTLQNCLVSANVAATTTTGNFGAGGGIYIDATGMLTAQQCTISDNIADCVATGSSTVVGSEGGGIFCLGSLHLTKCNVSGNVANGHARTAIGGGIANTSQQADLNDCRIADNTTASTSLTLNDGEGGGLFGGPYSITDSAIVNNTVTGPGGSGGGGGIFITSSSQLTLTQSNISNNWVETASGTGGGINFQGTTANIANCTFNNDSAASGGACSLSGTINLTNCTISGNTATIWGGGVYLLPGTQSGAEGCMLTATIVAGNSIIGGAGIGPDIYQEGGSTMFATGGSNLIGIGDVTGVGTSPFVNGVSHDQVGTTAVPIDPLLGPLQFNGGLNQTMALMASSPAIDAGYSSAQSIDQRGAARPRGARNDIGAYEYGAPIAADSTQTTPLNTTLVVPAPGVLANAASESGSSSFTATLVFPPNNGTLAGNTIGSDGSFTYTPNAGFSGSDFFAYQIADSTGPGTLATVQIDTNVSPKTTIHTFAAGLQMFSVPQDYRTIGLSTALTGFSETLAVWRPADNQYVLTTNANPDPFVPGQGYWVRLTQARNLTNSGITEIAPFFQVHLNSGWNMIGDPYEVPVALANITVAAQGTSNQVTMANANAANLLYLPLYAFQPGDTNYEVVNITNNLQPYLGYWIHAIQPCTLTFTYPSSD